MGFHDLIARIADAEETELRVGPQSQYVSYLDCLLFLNGLIDSTGKTQNMQNPEFGYVGKASQKRMLFARLCQRLSSSRATS